MKSLCSYICESGKLEKFKQQYSVRYSRVNHDITPSHKILVITQCTKTKNEKGENEAIPAHELYLGEGGTRFLKDVLPKQPVDWIIISGGYGVVSHDTKIRYYMDNIHSLSDGDLADMSDFLKWQKDIMSIMKKGQYNTVVLCCSHFYINALDLDEFADEFPDTEFVVFEDDIDAPEKFTRIDLTLKAREKFHAGMVFIKEKITCDWLEYIKNHKYININQFVKKIIG